MNGGRRGDQAIDCLGGYFYGDLQAKCNAQGKSPTELLKCKGFVWRQHLHQLGSIRRPAWQESVVGRWCDSLLSIDFTGPPASRVHVRCTGVLTVLNHLVRPIHRRGSTQSVQPAFNRHLH